MFALTIPFISKYVSYLRFSVEFEFDLEVLDSLGAVLIELELDEPLSSPCKVFCLEASRLANSLSACGLKWSEYFQKALSKEISYKVDAHFRIL